MNRLEVIRGKLDELRAGDRRFAVFGSATHRYRLEPPLAVDAIEAFEAEHGVELAGDYRAFIGSVGNGGAGPAYGLSPLGPPRDGWIHLAELGCGHFSALMPGGEVWTTDGDHELAPMSPAFFDWYEAWLDRSLLDWAHEQMVADMRAGAPRDPRLLELTAGAVGGHNRWAELQRSGYRALYRGDRAAALAWFEQAAAEHPAAGRGVPPSYYQALCDLHRLAGDVEARLEAAETGAAITVWSFRLRLLWEKADALAALGRDAEAVDALIERARMRDLEALADAVVALRARDRGAEAGGLIDEQAARRVGAWRERSVAEWRAEIERLASVRRP